jgi:hypothetical protein
LRRRFTGGSIIFTMKPPSNPGLYPPNPVWPLVRASEIDWSIASM